MGNQWNTDFPHGIISAPLERRDKDNIRIHAHYHFIIKVPFDTNLHGLAGLQTFVHLLVEEMARTGDAHHIIAGIQTDEVGKLQGCHTHNVLYRRFNHRIVARYADWLYAFRYQRIVESAAAFFLRVVYIHQTDMVRKIFHRIAFGIARYNGSCRVCRNRRIARFGRRFGSSLS